MTDASPIVPSAYLVPVVVDAGGLIHVEVGVEIGALPGGHLDPEGVASAVAEVLLVVAANLVAPTQPALADLIGAALDLMDDDA